MNSQYDIYLTRNLPGDNDLPNCPECKGTGVRTRPYIAGVVSVHSICSKCNGTGELTNEQIEDCLTQGALENEEERRRRE